MLQGLIIVLLCGFATSEDKKWVWDNKNSRSAALRDDDIKGSPRYEIFEPEGADFDYDRPQFRPQFAGNRPNYGRPPPQRPYPHPSYPSQNVDPGFNGNNGLGGRPPFKRFDTCSCTEKFNCQSPGLSYGHCDVGKSYCCYNKNGDIDIGPSPSRPIQSPANGVLVGPTNGGDFGYGHHDGSLHRPDYDRPSHLTNNYRPGPYRPGYGGLGGGLNSRPGVLVGPGGPTGLIGRPGGVRPLHGVGNGANGVLVGPGGPYDRPYGGYGGGYNRPPGGIGFFGRSAKNDDEIQAEPRSNDSKDKRDA